jgi:tRNA(fMet)-specific endonuclease VapC
MIVADTDVLIDFLNDHEPSASRVASALSQRMLWTTVVSRFEILSGVRSVRQEKEVFKLLTVLPVLLLDSPASDKAAEIRRNLERMGNSIAMGDTLIAGIVLRHGAVLMTRNRRHFERVPGLLLAETA